MCGQRDAGSNLHDMVEACERIIGFVSGVDDVEITNPDVPLWSCVLHHLTVLGEAAKHVPDELRQRRPEVPWKRIAGMRDRIVHYYFGIDDVAVISVVREAIPAVLPALRSLLEEVDREQGRAV